VYDQSMPRRRPRRRVERRYHPQAQPAAGALPVVVREVEWVERLAYTRTQAAEALGISRSTFNRRVLPHVDTVDTPWGAKLIPVDELERLLAERRRPPLGQAPTAARGRPPALPPEIVELIRAERAGGKTLRQIAQGLNASHTPTAHGGAMWWPSTVRAVLNRAG
jgi:Recombinase